MGRQEVMGVPGARGGLRNGPPSRSLAAAVSLSHPAGEAASGVGGILVGVVAMGALPPPGAQQGLLLISELTQGSIPMALPLVWLSPITP